MSVHELRPVSTLLEAYLADLAHRSGLPRPGILLRPLATPLALESSHHTPRGKGPAGATGTARSLCGESDRTPAYGRTTNGR